MRTATMLQTLTPAMAYICISYILPSRHTTMMLKILPLAEMLAKTCIRNALYHPDRPVGGKCEPS